MVNKTILVTDVVDASGSEFKIFGRYDAVALCRRGYQIKSSALVKCSISEKSLYENAEKKEILSH
jgi:hypothetical protein